MATPFDATMKHLVESQPEAWLAYVGLPVFGAVVEVIDADLSTLTAEADKVLKVNSPEPSLTHLEFQGGYEREMGERVLRYSVLLTYQHRMPVHSVVILLRREADGPAMTGRVEHRYPNGAVYLTFSYTIIRVWEKSWEEVLAGGLATLPLAPLAQGAQERLPEVFAQMQQRFAQKAAPSEARELWVATSIRYSDE